MNANPLDNLRDIHLPPETTSVVPAPGWWILALLALIVMYLVWRRLRRKVRQSRLRVAAESEFKNIAQKPLSTHLIFELLALFKRLYLAMPDAKPVHALSGEQWVEFVESIIGQPLTEPDLREKLLASLYAQSPSLTESEWRRVLEHSEKALQRWYQILQRQQESANA